MCVEKRVLKSRVCRAFFFYTAFNGKSKVWGERNVCNSELDIRNEKFLSFVENQLSVVFCEVYKNFTKTEFKGLKRGNLVVFLWKLQTSLDSNH